MVRTLPSIAGSVGSIPGWEAKIPHASWPKSKTKQYKTIYIYIYIYIYIKQKQYCNKFNKDVKNGSRHTHTKKSILPSTCLRVHSKDLTL